MGNYLMTKGLTRDGFSVPRNGLDRAIMLAADVDNDIFTAGSKVLSQGEAVYKLTGGNVRVYWTSKDNVLSKDEYAGWWKILGLRGAYADDTRHISPTTPEVQLVCYDDFADEAFSRRYVPNDYDASACSHSITRFAPDLLRDQLGFLLRPVEIAKRGGSAMASSPSRRPSSRRPAARARRCSPAGCRARRRGRPRRPP